MNDILDLIEKNKEIQTYFKYKKIDKNNTIFHEGDECKSFHVVKNGEIDIVSYYESGQEVIYNKITKGKSFGGNLIFSSEPFYRGDVFAKEETYLYEISKDTLVSLFQKNEMFLLAFLKAQSDFTKELNFKIKLLTFNYAKDRLMYFLNFYGGYVKIKSISELAKDLGLTREAVSRLIHQLEEDGVIELTQKYIKLKNSR